jgi:hypothetical protein
MGSGNRKMNATHDLAVLHAIGLSDGALMAAYLRRLQLKLSPLDLAGDTDYLPRASYWVRGQ